MHHPPHRSTVLLLNLSEVVIYMFLMYQHVALELKEICGQTLTGPPSGGYFPTLKELIIKDTLQLPLYTFEETKPASLLQAWVVL